MTVDEFLLGLLPLLGKISMKRTENITEYVREALGMLDGQTAFNLFDPTGHIAVSQIDFPNGVSVGVDADGNAMDVNLPAGWKVEGA